MEKKVYAITGATSGIGLETARALVARGESVVLCARNRAKADGVAAQLRASATAPIDIIDVDLADLATVRTAADRLRERGVDVLINNAGGIFHGKRAETRDGHERTFQTNVLGHALLTGLLLDHLCERRGRLVMLGSMMANMGRLDLDDLENRARYSNRTAYANAKLECVAFARGLATRAQRGGWGLVSLAAHPGWAQTGFGAGGRGPDPARFTGWFAAVGVAQSAAAGAKPVLLAATDPAAQPGTYFGPTGWGGSAGRPGNVRLPKGARDNARNQGLVDALGALAGVSFQR